MAYDGSDNVNAMDFHSCNTPRGMLYYNMDVLTEKQQKKLNKLKKRTVKEDEKYLANHPEIRACIAIIQRLVLRQRPRSDLNQVIGNYFAQSRCDIEEEIQEYISSRGARTCEGSHVELHSSPSTSTLSSTETYLSEGEEERDGEEDLIGVSLRQSKSFRVLEGSEDSLNKFSGFMKLRDSERTNEHKLAKVYVSKLIRDSFRTSLSAKDADRREKLVRVESYQSRQRYERLAPTIDILKTDVEDVNEDEGHAIEEVSKLTDPELHAYISEIAGNITQKSEDVYDLYDRRPSEGFLTTEVSEMLIADEGSKLQNDDAGGSKLNKRL